MSETEIFPPIKADRTPPPFQVKWTAPRSNLTHYKCRQWGSFPNGFYIQNVILKHDSNVILEVAMKYIYR